MICANPECDNEFEPRLISQLYCCPKCRDRVRVLSETARKRAATKARQKEREPWKEPAKGAGVGALNTRHIRASRRHEAELIDRVVAKAQAKGTQGGIDITGFRRIGKISGHKIG